MQEHIIKSWALQLILTHSLITDGINPDSAVVSSSAGLYYTLPVIGVYKFKWNAGVSVRGGYTPYYSYDPTPIINRGINFTNKTDNYGGYWQFQQPGVYEINIYWTCEYLEKSSMDRTTFLGSVTTPGETGGIKNWGQCHWGWLESDHQSPHCVINTVVIIDISNINEYFFVTNLQNSFVPGDLKGTVIIKYLSQN
jgi:hypothetical protein